MGSHSNIRASCFLGLDRPFPRFRPSSVYFGESPADGPLSAADMAGLCICPTVFPRGDSPPSADIHNDCYDIPDITPTRRPKARAARTPSACPWTTVNGLELQSECHSFFLTFFFYPIICGFSDGMAFGYIYTGVTFYYIRSGQLTLLGRLLLKVLPGNGDSVRISSPTTSQSFLSGETAYRRRRDVQLPERRDALHEHAAESPHPIACM
ncbi:hypothetical protein V8C44DRAFT_336210 [Trichoderma aethiopicum]